MKTIERVRALLPVGATIVCVENTYIPRHNGTTRRLTAGGVGWRECEILTGQDAGKRGFRMNLPTRARDVLAIGDRSVTYRIAPGRDETVTLEVLSRGAADPATDKVAAAAGTA